MIETITLLLSVSANAIVLIVMAFSRATTSIMRTRTQTNSEIEMYQNCLTILERGKNLKEVQELVKISIEKYWEKQHKEEKKENEKNIS